MENRGLSLVFLFAGGWAGAGAPGWTLRVLTDDGFISGVPVVVRVEIRDAGGRCARDRWDATATLSADRPGVTLSPDRVPLRNGMGSALVTIGGSGDFQLTATIGSLSASRLLSDRGAEPRSSVSGELPGAVTEWSGVVEVTGTVTVPAGRVLRILPGTIVLVSGVASGTGGTSLIVRGALESLGTADRPVSITARNPALAWGQIRHESASPSQYAHTFVTRAGNAPGEGHTGTGPAIRPTDSRIVFRSCTIGYGYPEGRPNQKILQASGSDLEFYDCLLTHSRMGPEIGATALVFEDSYSMDMTGTDDDDGIYLHDQREGQVIALRSSVFAFCDDDGIDTLGSSVTVEDTIVRDMHGEADADAKGISIFYGTADIRRCLIVNAMVGISAKGSNTTSCTVRVDRTTIVGERAGIKADDKYDQPDAKVLYFITNSIVQGSPNLAVETDYPPGDIHFSYSNLSDLSVPISAEHQISADPLFVNPAARDFHLQAASPCIDAGDPAAPPDPDGTRADQGVFPFSQGAAAPRFLRGSVNGDAGIDLSDAVAILLHLFGGMSIACEDAADVDDDGGLNVTDATVLLDYLFRDGPAPPEPASTCGADLTADPLGCSSGNGDCT
jgi:hypothetical protein